MRFLAKLRAVEKKCFKMGYFLIGNLMKAFIIFWNIQIFG